MKYDSLFVYVNFVLLDRPALFYNFLTKIFHLFSPTIQHNENQGQWITKNCVCAYAYLRMCVCVYAYAYVHIRCVCNGRLFLSSTVAFRQFLVTLRWFLWQCSFRSMMGSLRNTTASAGGLSPGIFWPAAEPLFPTDQWGLSSVVSYSPVIK